MVPPGLSLRQVLTSSSAATLETTIHHLRLRFANLRQESGFPGATIAFALPDGRTGALAIGYADVEGKVLLRAGDRMFSGSTGKTFVSAVAMQLVDEQAFRLDDKLDLYLGEEKWFERLPNAHSITLRMLLNHSSGLSNHPELDTFASDLRRNPDKVWKPEELVNYVLDRPPLFAAGQGWAYSDTNYILAGMVIERVTHDSYYHQLKKRILRPYHLTNTTPSDRRILPDVVPGYPDPTLPFGTGRKVMEHGKYAFNPQVEWTGGGLVSNSMDLARWTKLLYEGRLFSAGSLSQLLDGVATQDSDVRYGLGVFTYRSKGVVEYGHGGEMPGYNTTMMYWPKYKLAVAIQFNSDYSKFIVKPLREYAEEAERIIVHDFGLNAQ
jgi:D-alanyl-D-alanine carboxypeptidase